MDRKGTTSGLSQREALPKNEIKHSQKNVKKSPKKRQSEQLFSFIVVRERRNGHTLAHGE